ncbi:hypothetical protein BDV96DRAFT_642216 [Lophiotrema nucula]|uniref:DUF6604 domain-containing protein n=1 Tax=Lophiotrema nucula TaxID=690887 RepID=A0A6A5ZNE8_9PLEO|nr:hypothetical protein BDV96DRAFT_642216 [Lophiotrema nucula]
MSQTTTLPPSLLYNRFETLSSMIEEEPEFDNSPLFAEQDKPAMDAPSAIEDDPIEAYLMLHAYILEVEGLISHVCDTWKDAADSCVPVTLAGLLTTVAMGDIYHLENVYGPNSGFHPALLKAHSLHGQWKMDQFHASTNATTMEDMLQMPVSSTGCLNHKMGIRWPLVLLARALEDVDSRFQGKVVSDRQAINKYFRTPSEEAAAAADVCQAMVEFLKKCKVLDISNSREFDKKVMTGHLNTYYEPKYKGVESVLRSVLTVLKTQKEDTNNINVLLQRVVRPVSSTSPSTLFYTFPIFDISVVDLL